EHIEPDVVKALAGVPTLHFGRFVLIENTPGDSGGVLRLAFESNHDGNQDRHLAEVARALAPFEEVLFGAWEGYEKGQLAAFAAGHARRASSFYLGHPGLAVAQIVNDCEVRLRLEAILDDEAAEGRVKNATALDLRRRLLARLADGPPLVTGAVDRGLPPQPWSRLLFYVGGGLLVIVLGVVLLPLTVLVELWERHHEPEPELVKEEDIHLARINKKEDAIGQNGLTHYVAVRPGPLRKLTLRIVLWLVEQARRTIAYEGTLGGIPSIHFARWVDLGDGTLLFFSNYDGSWEAYLGDFVDKAHIYLSAVWSNTKWFPPTFALLLGGAAKESSFKQWVRTCQVENQIWYSGYPDLTVLDVHRNAAIREGASGEMTETEAKAWLARL
ncbi:MAG TPA: hypothetical protein VLT33_12875, partial [Labilithrix sp.]|nr:hypothetical protein [Labilithrix sp.]